MIRVALTTVEPSRRPAAVKKIDVTVHRQLVSNPAEAPSRLVVTAASTVRQDSDGHGGYPAQASTNSDDSLTLC